MPRKRVVVDYEAVRRAGQINPSQAELAAILGLSEATVANLLGTTARKGRKDPKFVAALAKGVAEGRNTLRRRQWAHALGSPREEQVVTRRTKNGTTTERLVVREEIRPSIRMLIWLGKQELGQSEKMETATTVVPGADQAPRRLIIKGDGETESPEA